MRTIQIRLRDSDKTLTEWNREGKAGALTNAKNYALRKGYSGVLYGDDSYRLFWREEGLGTVKVRTKKWDKFRVIG